MSKYKPGDRVRVTAEYGKLCKDGSMLAQVGKLGTVLGEEFEFYRTKLDNPSKEMIELCNGEHLFLETEIEHAEP